MQAFDLGLKLGQRAGVVDDIVSGGEALGAARLRCHDGADLRVGEAAATSHALVLQRLGQLTTQMRSQRSR